MSEKRCNPSKMNNPSTSLQVHMPNHDMERRRHNPMALALTFGDADLANSPLVGEDGSVHYTITTVGGCLGRRVTTICSSRGLEGTIDWRQRTFNVDGLSRPWDTLKSRTSNSMFSSSRTWDCGKNSYILKYDGSSKELLARSHLYPGKVAN
ncbi:hypothetical protein C8J57DRAFT_1505167 [Mycena rebaudengoi]|nr:hypothetical protein C8J57DRAFT_1505167 [Mycena rebaudengoi]